MYLSPSCTAVRSDVPPSDIRVSVGYMFMCPVSLHRVGLALLFTKVFSRFPGPCLNSHPVARRATNAPHPPTRGGSEWHGFLNWRPIIHKPQSPAKKWEWGTPSVTIFFPLFPCGWYHSHMPPCLRATPPLYRNKKKERNQKL